MPNLKTMLSWHRTDTFTDDTYESDFLEPWFQWVCVHTGLPSVDQLDFLKTFVINVLRVEPLMTHKAMNLLKTTV